MIPEIYELTHRIDSIQDNALVGLCIVFHSLIALVFAIQSIKIEGNKILKFLCALSVIFGLYASSNLSSAFIVNVLIQNNPVAEETKFWGRMLAHTNIVSLGLLSLTSIFRKK